MKLNVDLNELWSKVKEMGATERVVDVAQWIAAPPAEISTRSGGVVKEDTVQNVNGLLSADGTQVLLFMPKHGYYPIERSLIDPYNANKFHVTFCDKLEEMRSSNEYHKYRSTYNTSGMFEIFGISKSTGLEMRGEAKLNVCQKCLQKINYKGVNIRSKPFFLQYSNIQLILKRAIPRTGNRFQMQQESRLAIYAQAAWFS